MPLQITELARTFAEIEEALARVALSAEPMSTGDVQMTDEELRDQRCRGAASAACTTRDPMPFATAKDCFYPACGIDVEVVDDGRGGKLSRSRPTATCGWARGIRLVAIIWNLKTPGYEFRGDSIRPQAGREPGKPWTSYGTWSSQVMPHAYWSDTYSVTDLNTERGILYYNITVYPDRYTPGAPMTFSAAIANDAGQSGWLSMK